MSNALVILAYPLAFTPFHSSPHQHALPFGGVGSFFPAHEQQPSKKWPFTVDPVHPILPPQTLPFDGARISSGAPDPLPSCDRPPPPTACGHGMSRDGAGWAAGSARGLAQLACQTRLICRGPSGPPAWGLSGGSKGDQVEGSYLLGCTLCKGARWCLACTSKHHACAF